MKNFLLKCGFELIFSGSLAVFEERGEPANYGGWFSPPQAAKNVRANLRIVHHFGYVKVLVAASLRSAARLNGELSEKINFWFYR